MALKVVLYFQSGGEGWSEVYYTNDGAIPTFTGDPPRDFRPGTKAEKLITARLALMTSQNTMLHARVSDLSIPGAFLPYDLDDAVAHGTFDDSHDVQKGSAEVFSSLLLTYTAGLNARRKMFLGGIPESCVDAPQQYKPNDNFRAALSNFLKIVTSAPYCMRSRPARPVAFASRIQGFQVIGPGTFALVTPIVRPVTDPQSWYVLIRGLKTPFGWNGVYQARSIDNPANTMVIGPTRRPMRSLPAFVAGNPGTIQLFEPSFPVLTGWNIGHIVSRKRGRPFGVSRGRR